MPRNVALLVDPPSPKKPKIVPLTPDQARALLDAARGDRHETLYRLAFSLGLRVGEILGLRWDDVDLAAGTLRVEQAVQRIGGRLVMVEPKTETSRRTLPLPAALATSLTAHRARQAAERRRAGDRWRDHGLVFPSTVGTPLEPRNLTRAYKALLGAAGLPAFRFHDLRHSCGTFLANQGVPPRVTMEILGHSQISLTMNVYAHVLPEAQRLAAATMDALFPETAGGV